MKCPNNHSAFDELKIGTVKVDHCSQCEGLWFTKDELRQAKDSQDEFAKWFDFDLWDNEKNIKPVQGSKLCPIDQILLFKVRYEGSAIEIEACKQCSGIWLDKDEFKNIIEFVKRRSAYDLIHNYLQSLIEEGKEVFTGNESFKSELEDSARSQIAAI